MQGERGFRVEGTTRRWRGGFWEEKPKSGALGRAGPFFVFLFFLVRTKEGFFFHDWRSFDKRRLI